MQRSTCAFVVLLASVSCEKAASTPPAPSSAASGTASSDSIERTLNGLAGCRIDKGKLEPGCAGQDAWKALEKKLVGYKGAAPPEVADAGKRHIDHRDPALRLAAISLLASAFNDAGAAQSFVEHAKQEPDPHLVGEMVYRLRELASEPVLKDSAPAREFLLRAGEHSSEDVRAIALGALVDARSAAFPEASEKVLQKLTLDPSAVVRGVLCDAMLPTLDDRMLERLHTNLAAGNERADTSFECVVRAWTIADESVKPHEKAYRHTLSTLEQEPSKSAPQLSAGLARIEATLKQPAPARDAWQSATRPWFEAKKLAAALEKYLLHPQSNWLDRESAAKALIAAGVPKAELRRIRQRLPKSSQNVDARVQLDRAIDPKAHDSDW